MLASAQHAYLVDGVVMSGDEALSIDIRELRELQQSGNPIPQ